MVKPTPVDKRTYKGMVIENEELQNESSSNNRSTRHITLRLSKECKYEAGDHLALLPKTCVDLARKFTKRLCLDIDNDVVKFNKKYANDMIQQDEWYSLKDIIQMVDLSQPVGSDFVQVCINSTLCPPEKMKLQKLYDAMLTKKDNDTKVKMYLRPMDLLMAFRSCAPDLQNILPTLPLLKPRYYSISSSSNTMANPSYKLSLTDLDMDKYTYLSITVAIEKGERLDDDKRRWKGVVSTQVSEGLEKGMCLDCFVVENPGFRVPADPKTPMIMIGPGTGFAPMRGFMQHQQHQVSMKNSSSNNLLFFGSRNENVDFIYKKELLQLHQSNTVQLFTAFSRDNNDKVYVQHRIAENSKIVWDLIHNKNANIYICGDATRMAKDVYKQFANIAMSCGNLSQHQATEYLKYLQASGRYKTDVWASNIKPNTMLLSIDPESKMPLIFQS